jgi:hypothetical protein
MQGWTVDRVLQLAPDASSAKAGQGLSGARQWASSGHDANAVWGECQGSGAKPYQVRVDLSEPAFKCSCPSRKFPCKHAIGLMLMYAASGVAAATQPAWVEEWLAERSTRAQKNKEKADAPPKPVDAEAQRRRKENRLDRVGEGLSALKLWLADLVRGGLASMPTRGYAFFDEQARRLIDAQAPGAARRVEALAGTASSGAGWQRAFVEQIGLLHLLVRGFENRASLGQPTQDLILSTLGIPKPQEEVLLSTPIADRWAVIAQEVVVEGRLRVQHNWLVGERGGERAHVLSFAFASQPFDATLVPGFSFEAQVCRYPGEPLRALVKQKDAIAPLSQLPHSVAVEGLLDLYATHRSLNPWIEGLAVGLASVIPVRTPAGWAWLDPTGRSIAMHADDATAWRLAAISGGDAIDAVVLYDGRRARPLATMSAGQYRAVLPPSIEGVAA